MMVLTLFSNTIITYSLPQVSITKATSGKIKGSKEYTGFLEYESNVIIRAESEKKIKSIEVSVGDVIKKDDIILSLEPGSDEAYRDAVTQLDELKNQYKIMLLENTESKYDIEKYNIQNAKEDLIAAQRLYDEIVSLEDTLQTQGKVLQQAKQSLAAFESMHLITENDLDEDTNYNKSEYYNLKNNVDNAQSEYNRINEKITMSSSEAQDNVREKERALRLLELEYDEKTQSDTQSKQVTDLNLNSLKSSITLQEEKVNEEYNKLNNNIITSPANGIVISIDAEIGANTIEGDEIAVIAINNNKYSVEIDVTNEVASSLHNGAIFQYKTRNNVIGEATISKIKSNEDKTIKTVDFLITSDEVANNEEITIMIGEGDITANVIVPNNAVCEDSGGSFVYVVDAEYGSFGNRYTLKKVSVKIGPTDETNTVIEEGITTNDNIVVAYDKNLEDGQRVKMANGDK